MIVCNVYDKVLYLIRNKSYSDASVHFCAPNIHVPAHLRYNPATRSNSAKAGEPENDPCLNRCSRLAVSLGSQLTRGPEVYFQERLQGSFHPGDYLQGRQHPSSHWRHLRTRKGRLPG